MRAFVALDIPSETRAEIRALMASLEPKLPGLRFISPDTVHLTLRFLGDASEEAIAALQRKLAPAAAACPAARVALRGLGVFPERGSPNVLWLGIDLPDSILALQRACEEAAVACGFPREGKPFRSHVTLGRWRDRVRRPELPPVDLGTVDLESLVLFKSELNPKGAVHTALASYRLS
jgi:RNA 2',3'-cyclic 3'-phosphodiesterase